MATPVHAPGTVAQGTACGKLVMVTTRVASVGDQVTCKKCVELWMGAIPRPFDFRRRLVHQVGKSPGLLYCGTVASREMLTSHRSSQVTCPKCLARFKGPEINRE